MDCGEGVTDGAGCGRNPRTGGWLVRARRLPSAGLGRNPRTGGWLVRARRLSVARCGRILRTTQIRVRTVQPPAVSRGWNPRPLPQQVRNKRHLAGISFRIQQTPSPMDPRRTASSPRKLVALTPPKCLEAAVQQLKTSCDLPSCNNAPTWHVQDLRFPLPRLSLPLTVDVPNKLCHTGESRGGNHERKANVSQRPFHACRVEGNVRCPNHSV